MNMNMEGVREGDGIHVWNSNLIYSTQVGGTHSN